MLVRRADIEGALYLSFDQESDAIAVLGVGMRQLAEAFVEKLRIGHCAKRCVLSVCTEGARKPSRRQLTLGASLDELYDSEMPLLGIVSTSLEVRQIGAMTSHVSVGLGLR